MAEETQQEEILGKAYDFRLVRRLWNFIIPTNGCFILSLLLLPLQQAFGLAQPYLMKIGIDQYIARQESLGLADRHAAVSRRPDRRNRRHVYVQYYLSMLVAQRCLADLRVAIFSHVQKLPMSYFDRNPVGRLVTRMTTDVDVLQEMFSSGVMTLVSDFVMVFWIYRYHVVSRRRVGAVVSLALIPPMAFAINFFRVKARQTYRQIRERIARINAYLGEADLGHGGDPTICPRRKNLSEFEALNADHRDAYHLSNLI